MFKTRGGVKGVLINVKKNCRIGEEIHPLSVSTYEESLLQGLFLRGGPHYLCGKRENSAIASHGHGKGSSPEVFFLHVIPSQEWMDMGHKDNARLTFVTTWRESCSKYSCLTNKIFPNNQEVAWAEGEILRETRPASLRIRYMVKIA